jgi:hypothetical protein
LDRSAASRRWEQPDVTTTREALRRRSGYDRSFIVVWSVIVAASCGFWGAVLWLILRR